MICDVHCLAKIVLPEFLLPKKVSLSKDDVIILENGLKNIADIIKKDTKKDITI